MNPQEKKYRVLLVDDHPIVREQLGRMINRQKDLEVCGECGDAADCLKLARTVRADLAIVDLSLKNSHGIDLIKDLRLHHPKLIVLVLSMHDEVAYAESALRVGARGYVTKQDATKSILVAIRRVLGGEIYLNEKMGAQLVGMLLQGRDPAAGLDPSARLSPRELQLFELIGRGLPTREIAKILGIGTKTVDAHRANLKDKLGVESIEDLRAAAEKWVHYRASSPPTP